MDHPLTQMEYQFHSYEIDTKQMLLILTTAIGFLNLWFGSRYCPVSKNPSPGKRVKIGQRYKIVEEISAYEDLVLDEDDNRSDAEKKLNYYLNQGHEVYLIDEKGKSL